jgi:hypothetical protein
MWIAFFSALGSVIFVYGWFGYNWLGFSKHAAVVITGVGSVLVITSSIPAVWAIETYLDSKPDEPEVPPTNDASDALDFPQEHNTGTSRLEYRHANTIELGYISLTRRQWHALVTELKRNSPGHVIAWSRRKMEKHRMPQIDGTDWEVFTGLTARNEQGDTKFKALTKELRNLRIVNRAGKAITDYGWQELCRVAGLDVVL